MKEAALQLALNQTTTQAKLNILREYLQAYILSILRDAEFFQAAAFVGGTALRFLHDLPRFSEDLDFSLEKKGGYSFADLLEKIKKELVAAGYEISMSCREEKTVQFAMIKFGGLLYEGGLSPLRSQKFAVKLEIDTRPPKGAIMETKIVNKYFPIAFLAHDLPSLFAGKLCALLCRKYAKGRDFFDLGWYLSRWRNLSPNLTLLGNALKQMGWKGKLTGEDGWREPAAKVVEQVDWKKISREIETFLENPSDASIFTREATLGLLRKKE